MRLSTVILPIYRWAEAERIWQQAEALGFHTGYTYDHLSWRTFRDQSWFGAIPTLTAAATATRTLRIGTMVASPNFRHPVTLAKELMTLDDISNGRLTVGLGSGGVGFDASVLGRSPWPRKERADRFAEFVPLLDRLLTEPVTTAHGPHYSATEARMVPGCVQQPRVPFVVAATGPRGFRLASEYGQGWVTYGDPSHPAAAPAKATAVVGAQMERLEASCAARGRAYGSIDKMLLQGSTAEQPLASLDAFVDWAGRYQMLGMTDIVIHWPVPDSVYASDVGVFERIATEGMAQLPSAFGDPLAR